MPVHTFSWVRLGVVMRDLQVAQALPFSRGWCCSIFRPAVVPLRVVVEVVAAGMVDDLNGVGREGPGGWWWVTTTGSGARTSVPSDGFGFKQGKVVLTVK